MNNNNFKNFSAANYDDDFIKTINFVKIFINHK